MNTTHGCSRGKSRWHSRLLLVATIALQPALPSFAQEINTQEDGALTSSVTRILFAPFTGSVTRITGEELKRFGNQNLLQSLKHLDPAFAIVEDVERGSDPNLLPEARVWGASSLLDGFVGLPRPLFILDGLEISARQAFDLDINRIASVTLLKDAAAKTVYGPRGTFGVVRIESVRPDAGKLKTHYAGDLNVAKADLSSYDRVNAQEQLQLDVATGRYASTNPNDQRLLTGEYNRVKQAVDRGVNTNWLKEPLRVATGHKHSLFLETGNDRTRGGLDLSYNRIIGVMKDAYRENVAGAFTFSFRAGRITFENTLSALLNHAADSPHEAFSEYAMLNSYWEPRDENGNPNMVLGKLRLSPVAPITTYFNPLYCASSGTKHAARYTMITDNFHAGWQALDNLNVSLRLGYSDQQDKRDDGRFGFTVGRSGGTAFFYNSSLAKEKERILHANLLLGYSALWQKHLLLANASLAWRRETGESHLFATSLMSIDPGDTLDDYPNSGPVNLYAETRVQEVVGVAAVNYEYDKRYLLDLSYCVDASSALKADDRRGHSWSAGAGWNLHEEPFLKQSDWIKQLKLRGSIGRSSRPTLNSSLSQEFNVGLDARLGSRFTARFDYHVRDMGDFFVTIFLPGATGFSSYTENLGEIRATGFDAIVSWTVHDNPAHASRLALFASVAANESKFKRKSDVATDTDTNPAAAGHLGFNATRKGFSLNASFGYRLGREYYNYNQTLIDRYNEIRNPLADRWGTTGDDQASSTTRFIEKQDVKEIALSSIVLSREFGRARLGNFYLDRTKLSLYMTDLFRFSTAKTERGLAHPFARSFSLSLQTTF